MTTENRLYFCSVLGQALIRNVTFDNCLTRHNVVQSVLTNFSLLNWILLYAHGCRRLKGALWVQLRSGLPVLCPILHFFLHFSSIEKMNFVFFSSSLMSRDAKSEFLSWRCFVSRTRHFSSKFLMNFQMTTVCVNQANARNLWVRFCETWLVSSCWRAGFSSSPLLSGLFFRLFRGNFLGRIFEFSIHLLLFAIKS